MALHVVAHKPCVICFTVIVLFVFNGLIAYSQRNKINLLHIESRSSARFPNQYEFMVECAPGGDLQTAIDTLKQHCTYFSIISRNYKENRGEINNSFEGK